MLASDSMGSGGSRIRLCGHLLVEVQGRKVDGDLPGAKGRLLFAYLVLNRERSMTRGELLMAVYGEGVSPDRHPSLTVLLSKLRSVIGGDLLQGRSEIELRLPGAVFVDVEAAREALHRAESHVALGEWAESWGPAGVAYHVARRPLLLGEDRPWLDEWRRRLDDIKLRGLECLAVARLGLGGPALTQAVDCARQLIELAPYRETGHRILMESLEQRGNFAEALIAYEDLRVTLWDDLGVTPSPDVQSVHKRLLGRSTRAKG